MEKFFKSVPSLSSLGKKNKAENLTGSSRGGYLKGVVRRSDSTWVKCLDSSLGSIEAMHSKQGQRRLRPIKRLWGITGRS